jgi:magnesium transporter
MPKLLKKRSQKAGLPPGSLVYIGSEQSEKVKIRLIDYSDKKIRERELKTVEECFPFKETPTVTWIDIDGIKHTEIIEKIGKCFDLHPLVLEDIVNTEQRPKIEDFKNYVFIVLKMLSYDEKHADIKVEQVSLILGRNFVISFQDNVEGDVFDNVRQRLRTNRGRLRKMGADYLVYSLMDAIVDNYFIILEKIGERIEDMEDELLLKPHAEIIKEINKLKRSTIFLRKSVWPLREVVSIMERGEIPLIKKETTVYFRDIYDHSIQIIDNIETLRDILAGMLEIYLSSLSYKMNEIMKVLTIIATIFIPLTFVVGIYGMNFHYMPELEWHWGYPLVWLAMLFIAGMMLYYFRRKQWM